jgi:serine/threonine protein kinase
LTEAVDIYGFGIVLFEMLTGSLPFTGTTPMDVALQRLRRPAAKPSERLSTIPAAWDDFVGRCLAREPRRRFASADSALAALERLSEAVSPRRRFRKTHAGMALALLASVVALFELLPFVRAGFDIAELRKRKGESASQHSGASARQSQLASVSSAAFSTTDVPESAAQRARADDVSSSRNSLGPSQYSGLIATSPALGSAYRAGSSTGDALARRTGIANQRENSKPARPNAAALQQGSNSVMSEATDQRRDTELLARKVTAAQAGSAHTGTAQAPAESADLDEWIDPFERKTER